jgi:hypothetical protein
MKVLFHEDFYQVYAHDPAEEPGRIQVVMDVIGPRVETVIAKPASEEDIPAVHSMDHVESVRSQGLYPITALAAGGAIQAALLGLVEPSFGLIGLASFPAIP